MIAINSKSLMQPYFITLQWPERDESTVIETSAPSIEGPMKLAQKFSEPGVIVSLTNSAGVVEWKA